VNETRAVIQLIEKAADKITKKHKLAYTLAGSYIRNTWLPDKKEFDVFICFPEDLKREKLEEKGLLVGKKIVKELKGKYLIAYAEHPYVRAQITHKTGGKPPVKNAYDVDIVPCYTVKSATEIKSAVDRTPFHNKWLEKNLPPRLSTDVRLFKQFCKGIRIYGSDTKTQGLSGYLCELLVIHYRGFQKLLQAITKWGPGEVLVDLEKHHKGLVPENLKERFRDQPLIAIDPVDLNRNVAAAFSVENFMKLVSAAKAFLQSPSESFFFRKIEFDPRKLEKLMKERKTQVLVLAFIRPNVIVDVLWPQMRKTLKRLEAILAEYEFSVEGADVWSDDKEKCAMFFEMEVWELPEIRKIGGPPVFLKQRALEFKNKYEPMGRLWVEGEYLYAEVKRKFLTAESRLKDILKDKEKKLLEKGIASYVASSIAKKGFQVLKDDKVPKFARDNPEFGELLQSYFGKKLSGETVQ
jgi:tRNA nucleotidyltransferase (CCA-adding enzyme)